MPQYDVSNSYENTDEKEILDCAKNRQYIGVRTMFMENDGIPIMRERTREETEAALDLLELSRSIPFSPTLNGTYNPDEDWTASNQTYIQQSQPPEVEYIYQNNANMTNVGEYPYYTESQISNTDGLNGANGTPLTPPISECSSDTENITGESRTVVIKAITYTYNTLTDGRKKKKVGDDPKTATRNQKRFICNQCNKEYATSSNLSRHKQTHRSLDSQDARQCVQCHKIYVSMPAMSMHLMTHKLRHKCKLCGKRFSRSWLLQGHYRSHTGERPYGCAHCGKAFADRSNLRAHMQTHSEAKFYRCTHCKKKFALKSYLTKHLESCSKQEKPIHNSEQPICSLQSPSA